MGAKTLLVISVLYTLLITYLSLVQLGKISLGSFNPTDKMMHLGAYFGLGFLWFLYYIFKKPGEIQKNHHFFNITIVIIVFGMLIEVLQGTLTAYRTPDWADILANSIGVLIAFGICRGFLKFFMRLKHKINSFL